MKTFKDILVIIVALGSLAGAVLLVIGFPGLGDPTPREAIVLNVLLFFLSSFFAIILGYYYSRIGSRELIDIVAKASTEKMVHLSLQLQRLSDYLHETESTAREQMSINMHAALNAYQHRLDAAAETAGNLASSNEAFRNDWLGVVSVHMRQEIEGKYENLRQYLQDAETMERLQEQRSSGDASPEAERDLDTRIQEVMKRIEDKARQLPIPVVSRQFAKTPAVEARQDLGPNAATPVRQEGRLTIIILRHVFNATGSGRLEPPMCNVPTIEARLIKHPDNLNPDNLKISPGTGTTHDFNVSMKSTEFGAHLPVGEYVFEYTACAQPPETVENNESQPEVEEVEATDLAD